MKDGATLLVGKLNFDSKFQSSPPNEGRSNSIIANSAIMDI